ncbi:MAG: hypothetical protein R2716_12055 [Microthrixaceae bacterium]
MKQFVGSVAILSMHTSPWPNPTGTPEGMNVYVRELAGSSPGPASR